MGLEVPYAPTFYINMGQPRIMVSGHFDTVHPIGTLLQNPFREKQGKIYGPGHKT